MREPPNRGCAGAVALLFVVVGLLVVAVDWFAARRRVASDDTLGN